MLLIEGTTSSPTVTYDEKLHILTITGESYPENSFEFYEPVFEWLQTELPRIDSFILEINIRYMNSSSTKCMLDILDVVSERAEAGGTVRVRWLYDRENERALELAEEFLEDLEIPFETVPVTPEEAYS